MEDGLRWKTTFDGRQPWMEDNLWWKTTFDGRQPSMEDKLWWKTTFDGRRPLTEDDLWWKTTFDGRQPLTEDNLWRKTTFDGRQPLMEDDLLRKTTFDRGTVYYLKKMFMTPQLDSHSTTDPKPKILSAVLTGNRISGDGRNARGIMHVWVCRKDDIFRQRRLNHSGVGGGKLHLEECTRPELTQP